MRKRIIVLLCIALFSLTACQNKVTEPSETASNIENQSSSSLDGTQSRTFHRSDSDVPTWRFNHSGKYPW